MGLRSKGMYHDAKEPHFMGCRRLGIGPFRAACKIPINNLLIPINDPLIPYAIGLSRSLMPLAPFPIAVDIPMCHSYGHTYSITTDR